EDLQTGAAEQSVLDELGGKVAVELLVDQGMFRGSGLFLGLLAEPYHPGQRVVQPVGLEVRMGDERLRGRPADDHATAVHPRGDRVYILVDEMPQIHPALGARQPVAVGQREGCIWRRSATSMNTSSPLG